MSGPKTSQDKSSPETFPAPWHMIEIATPDKSWEEANMKLP